MSSKRIALDQTLVIGVDVASEEHVALIRGPGGLEVGPFPFAKITRARASCSSSAD